MIKKRWSPVGGMMSSLKPSYEDWHKRIRLIRLLSLFLVFLFCRVLQQARYLELLSQSEILCTSDEQSINIIDKNAATINWSVLLIIISICLCVALGLIHVLRKRYIKTI